MKKKTMTFLICSIILLIAVTAGGLVLCANSLESDTDNTITEVGNVYMTGLNERMALHFESTIESRLNRLENIVTAVPPGKYDNYNQMQQELSYAAEARGLVYLAYYSPDGEFETVYGDPVTIDNPDTFLESMNNGEMRIAAGKDSEGESLAVMGVYCEYTMKNGEKTTALVAGITMNYLKSLLALDSEDSIVYSHIIRADGSYVMKSRESVLGDNFFDIINGSAITESGEPIKDGEESFQKCMEKGDDFSVIYQVSDDETEHIYCTSLPYCDWYLISVMPYGELDSAINGMAAQRNRVMLIYLGVVVAVMIAIFLGYFRMSRKHMRMLDKARSDALEASRAKSSFLSNMSHDIRTPMNAIVGMTAIAATNIDNKPKLTDCLKKITLSSRHLLGLINDILDMSTIESGKMTLSTELVSLRDVMDGIVNIIQPQIKAKNQRFDIFISNIDAENVYCDSVRLNQILINFLSNAIKFTPEGGSVTVSLSEEASPLGENYTKVKLSVKDTGIGMSDEFKEHIFDSFAREDNTRVHKTEGTGLGMAITKHIIDAMGGSVEVFSQQGKGTEFKVELDMEIAEIDEEEMLLPEWNMLVVDDDEALCETAVSSLKSIGVIAESAYSGEQAVAKVCERNKRHDDYSIVLIDWQMPGIDGIETARRIRRAVGDDVPILLISAYDWSDIEEEARAAGVNGFISKPLFKSTLFYGLKGFAYTSSPETDEAAECVHDFCGKKIIVAEDNDLNWEIAYELLRPTGLEIERAENGKVCVEKINGSPEGTYSCILMDLRMPIMTGYEATLAIRSSDRKDRNIPIIAMTADAFSQDIQHCLEMGMNGHVAKPIDIKEVTRLLERFI